MFDWLSTKTRPNLKQLSKGLTLTSPTRENELWIAAISESINLAEYIPSQYIDVIKEAVICSTTMGSNGLQDLVPFIATHMGIESHQARLIALDLTRKVYSNFTKLRMLKLGIKKFEWLHTGGGNNPFQEHIAMSGKIYSFDDPPVINFKIGQRGFPGDLPGCRCKMLPIVEFDKD